MVILDAETPSLKRAFVVMKRVVGLDVSPNTIERVALEVGNDLEVAEQEHWQRILTGEVVVPSAAIIEFDGGRIRTRKTGCGPGVHLDAKGWNETKNAIFVSAASETSEVDPQRDPPVCFLDIDHVTKLAEKAKTKENTGSDASLPPAQEDQDQVCETPVSHKPQRLLRTVVASMKNSRQFGAQMAREATRRRFDEASRKAYVADGLTCNWTIHAEHFPDYDAILDFTHAVTYLFNASLLCFGKTDEAWAVYRDWLTNVWRGEVGVVIAELKTHQDRIGLLLENADEDDPREQLRRVIGYLESNRQRMRYDEYRRSGLPTTSAWMESTVKEMNYRIKGTEMFWNNPAGAEAILQIRAAALSDDDRLVRLLSHRPGQRPLRRNHSAAQAA